MKKPLLLLLTTLSLFIPGGVLLALDNANPICSEQEDWTRNAAMSNYFRGHYYDFDVYGGAFISAPGRSERILLEPIEERIRVGSLWHERILGIIERLGRLMPHIKSPLDLPPMIQQMRAGSVRGTQSDEYIEFLRVSLAQDLLRSGDEAGARAADFLGYLATLEEQANALRDGEFSAAQLQRFYATLTQAEVSRKAFRTALKTAIFTDDLHDRMSARLVEYCDLAIAP